MPEAVGYLHMLWWWALDYAPDGDLARWDPEWIADACMWEGDSERFMMALQHSHWIVDGELQTHPPRLLQEMLRAAEQRRLYHHVRRARLKAVPYERVRRQDIVERDGLICYLCGLALRAPEVTLDHVIPLARGGPHTADNLRIACRPCNSRKGAR